LSRNKDEKWNVGAVKHGAIGDIGYPRISVLYTADTYHPDLSDPEDAVLARVSELIAGDKVKGTALWWELTPVIDGGISDENMWKILNNPEWMSGEKLNFAKQLYDS
jgi:hypothetical protein